MAGLAGHPRGATPEESAMDRPEVPQSVPSRQLFAGHGRPREDDPALPTPSTAIKPIDRPDDPDCRQPTQDRKAGREREDDPAKAGISHVEPPVQRPDDDPGDDPLPRLPGPGFEREEVE